MRAFGCWVLMLSLSGAAFAKDAKKPDLNAQGFKEYKKGNHKKALELFTKARKQTPENAYAWFNWARVTAVLNAKVEPDDCERASDWRYLAIASLDEGLRRGRAQVVEKINEDEPGLVPLEKTGVFKRWWSAVQPPPSNDAELKGFISKHPRWFHHEGVLQVQTELASDGRVLQTRMMGEVEEKEIGRWSVKDGALQLALAGAKPVKAAIKQSPWCFAEGKHCFTVLRLQDENFDHDWELGPPDDDCGP